ncbi:MAG: family 1 glycosylhydrolase [Actinobacteria bacterium]|jgi:beta-glucosidase/6-phospho-beta-glucosidase/beta-galactosidase|nr:family 1 glycosylhydrolase [Actinomycetota bacterium]
MSITSVNNDLPGIPDSFRFGVATASYQVEGGINGPGEPANNWSLWEALGRVEPSGLACDFWRKYEDQLDLVAGMGCNGFRMSVEWARIEPQEGDIDTDALEGYGRILDACHERGIQPLVTLHHFTHPAFLGEEFWLRPDSPQRFAAFVEIVLGALGDKCSQWVTINEMNMLAIASYAFPVFPPGRLLDFNDAFITLFHLLEAHVRAYEVIHRLQGGAVVGFNNYALSIYELDRMLPDLLLARSHGVAKEDLGTFLRERRAEHYMGLSPPDPLEAGLRAMAKSMLLPAGMGAHGRSRISRALDGLRGLFMSDDDTVAGNQYDRSDPFKFLMDSFGRLLDVLGSRFKVGTDSLERLVEVVWSSPYERTMDVSQFDYYDPAASHELKVPGRRTTGGRVMTPRRMLWEMSPDPTALVSWCRLEGEPGLDTWVVENGMCNRVRNGRSYRRLDGWDRARYLRENIAAVVAARDAGLPVTAYYHWTLVDNYEWGSYQPRFGIYGMDRERGLKIMDTDAMGVDAAGTYRSIIEGLRRGDRTVLLPER